MASSASLAAANQASTVLFYSSQFDAEGHRFHSQFESEAWPQFGLTALGIPLVALAVVAAVHAVSGRPGAGQFQEAENGGASDRRRFAV